MKGEFDFKKLFVFDMANNHQGSVEHGLRIIREIGKVAGKNSIRGALKFQFRDLDTFIHPAHMENSPNKHIPRFLSTRLSQKDFKIMTDEVRKNGLITMSTPFDEKSVDMIMELDLKIIKIASCSARDWPLIESIAECNKPVIFSTAGLTEKEIDDLVSFFDHRRVQFAIMHCVAVYPTPEEMFQLNRIDNLRNRYPQKVIGFSTHEKPDNLVPVTTAVSKGAEILERHVGVETENIKLNAYSSTPKQIDRWIRAAQRARILCGSHERTPSAPEEISSLMSLQRGVYTRHSLKKGARISRDDVYFAMPFTAGQQSSGNWLEGIILKEDLERDMPLMMKSLKIPGHSNNHHLVTAVHTIKGMLNEARIALSTDFETEFSHHYGISEFAKTGATIITCINRNYCKKLIILMPNQKHPGHYHKKKEETFQVLYGKLNLDIEGRKHGLYPGDIQLVQQGVWHEFWTDTGAVFEEISTTHFNNDSFYEDKTINTLRRDQRKTVVNQWGRYQL